MLKQTAPNEWEIVPTPFPKELKDDSKTVLELARIGFVYQGFDGNFHSFIHRYTYSERKPSSDNHSYEEILAYGTGKSILIGYVNSRYGETCSFHRYSFNKIKSGMGFLFFEAIIDEQARVKETVERTEKEELDRLVKPTSFIRAISYHNQAGVIRKKYERIRQFLSLLDPEDFGYDKIHGDKVSNAENKRRHDGGVHRYETLSE